MGYNIFSYAIDKQKVLNAIGSMDDGLLNDVIETDTFELYAGQDSGTLSTKHALQHIIFGQPYAMAAGHAYWYAFIALCAYLGDALPATHEINLGYETDLINGYLESDFGLKMVVEELLLDGQDGFGLPAPADWPLHGLLNTSTLLLLKEKFAGIEITGDMLDELLDEDEEKEMAYDSIKQLKENVSYCLDKNMELISFCH